MPTNDSQLETLLARLAESDHPATRPTLDAERLVTRARDRRRRRTVSTVAAMMLGGLVTLGVLAQTSHEPNTSGDSPTLAETSLGPTTPAMADSWDAIRADLARLEQQTAELNAQWSAKAAELNALIDQPTNDAELTTDDRLPGEPSLAELREQVAALEHKLAVDTTELEYDYQRSRSAALQLQLADLDAAKHPDRAQQAYRQIASIYPDTQWGRQAQRMLSQAP
ncbi:hypothetical protein [Aeoliella mucimassa]|uniref:Uncharacterized protein n=1 Tax=Aeoliella mucimassa TaxID=2527972 RepID=A0A518AI25_9BACT|nr:hypothetical protein [Aeoliella mucimassa]QDU54376.1 hypothetical protein Pan181_05570 [Aeoliella mucimassa]